MANDRDALITGIGLVSCLGEGDDAHWAALTRPGGFQPVVDEGRIRPLPGAPRHGAGTRQADPQARRPAADGGVAAHRHLRRRAGARFRRGEGRCRSLSRMNMIVAAAGGERDTAADESILSALATSADPGALLNQRLMSDLRPTMFLAQLSNLLAGNISIVHGVVGSSRTFMGEEAAGADAVRIACARIAAGQGELAWSAASYNAERPDI